MADGRICDSKFMVGLNLNLINILIILNIFYIYIFYIYL